MEKYIQYAALIQSQIWRMFHDDCENYIDPQEFNDPEIFKSFLHALSTVVPCAIFNGITGEENNHLEFNHIANHIVFEYAKLVENSESESENQ